LGRFTNDFFSKLTLKLGQKKNSEKKKIVDYNFDPLARTRKLFKLYSLQHLFSDDFIKIERLK